jgi:hypothetical protein
MASQKRFLPAEYISDLVLVNPEEQLPGYQAAASDGRRSTPLRMM